VNPATYIELPVPSQESEQSSICVLRVSILPLSMIFLLDFWTVPTVWYFLFFYIFELFQQCGIFNCFSFYYWKYFIFFSLFFRHPL